jgi:hypothetical protein
MDQRMKHEVYVAKYIDEHERIFIPAPGYKYIFEFIHGHMSFHIRLL